MLFVTICWGSLPHPNLRADLADEQVVVMPLQQVCHKKPSSSRYECASIVGHSLYLLWKASFITPDNMRPITLADCALPRCPFFALFSYGQKGTDAAHEHRQGRWNWNYSRKAQIIYIGPAAWR